MQQKEDCKVVIVERSDGVLEKIDVDEILVCTGRKPNVEVCILESFLQTLLRAWDLKQQV